MTKYFEHRPFTFWFSVLGISILVLAAALVVGSYRESRGTLPSPTPAGALARASGSELARELMVAYGAVITAPDTATALQATEHLIEVGEACVQAGWGTARCTEVVDRAEDLEAFLTEHLEDEEIDRSELISKRRVVGTAVSAVVAETP